MKEDKMIDEKKVPPLKMVVVSELKKLQYDWQGNYHMLSELMKKSEYVLSHAEEINETSLSEFMILMADMFEKYQDMVLKINEYSEKK